ncbi:MAG: ABC transporter permease subunit, partial [Anaerolineae bacterium]|nr:ABC transporter permease subunit [Anaerolineae bacterium]
VDFVSTLGGAVPGTILGIGFVLAFNPVPWFVVVLLYGLLAFYLAATALPMNDWAEHRGEHTENAALDPASAPQHNRKKSLIRIGVLAAGTAGGVGMTVLFNLFGEFMAMYLLAIAYWLLALGALIRGLQRGGGARRLSRVPRSAWLLFGMGFYLMMYNWIDFLAQPIAALSRAIERGFWSNALFQISDHLAVFFQTPPPLTAIIYTFLSVLVVADPLWLGQERAGKHLPVKPILTGLLLALIAVLCFVGRPLALVGTPFIIIAAFVVRSLPASVRAGVAALQQIDPSIEEASGILGADAQYTFRHVTLPLILPALLAGLIFSFTRHMTSLSAIIFLISARWRIVTASILSEWEQGGVSIAAGYSTVIIIVVLIAIGVLYFVTRKLLGGRGEVDLTLGA